MPVATSDMPARIGRTAAGPRSQAQRGLMYAAASKKGGAGGVSRKVAKEFVAADKPGKLPRRAKRKPVARGIINNGS